MITDNQVFNYLQEILSLSNDDDHHDHRDNFHARRRYLVFHRDHDHDKNCLFKFTANQVFNHLLKFLNLSIDDDHHDHRVYLHVHHYLFFHHGRNRDFGFHFEITTSQFISHLLKLLNLSFDGDLRDRLFFHHDRDLDTYFQFKFTTSQVFTHLLRFDIPWNVDYLLFRHDFNIHHDFSYN